MVSGARSGSLTHSVVSDALGGAARALLHLSTSSSVQS